VEQRRLLQDQALWQFNYLTGLEEDLTESNLGGGFSVFTGSPVGAPADYVRQSDGQMRARVTVRQTGPSTALLPCVSIEVANQLVAD
jgi:hypothetical protein